MANQVVLSELKITQVPEALAGVLDLIEVDTETGEVMCPTDQQIQFAAEDALVGTALYCRRLAQMIANTKEVEATLRARRQADEKRLEWLKARIGDGLDSLSIEGITAPIIKLKWRKTPPAVIVEDETLIPAEYIRTKTITEVDKKAIAAAIKEGGEVLGAHLESHRSIKID